MRARDPDRPDRRAGRRRRFDNRCTGLGLGGGYPCQWLSLADAELALFQRGLEVRSDVTDQRDVAGGHHQGQQRKS
jgi:hypothetical protein